MSGLTPVLIVEATISSLHALILSGKVTARQIVEAHLDRIEQYDRRGPALWSIIELNSRALDDADELDRSYAATGQLSGRLHGIPVLVKDNYDVAGLQTTGGSAAMLGWIPAKDAAIITKLRAAGAIILAKTTMSEWARGGIDNINSVLPGFTRNPYNTAHATGGSSGGTGAGLAASFGVVGLGSDTFGSIRNPSSNNALAGLRPSWGLVSRAGMIGLYDARDTAGPMARTVTDLVTLLDVISGPDSADKATAHAEVHVPAAFRSSLRMDGAQGKRIGVLRQACFPEDSDPQVLGLLEKAINTLRDIGAVIIDPFIIPDYSKFPSQLHPPSEVRKAIETYLAGTGPAYPKTVADIVASGKFHPLHEVGLKVAANAPAPEDDPVVVQLEKKEAAMRVAYESAMKEHDVDCFVMPVASHPPKLNGDRDTTPTGMTTWIASALHWPAVSVPMGFTYEDLPSGLQIVGKPWSDQTLLEIAFAFEQAASHRKPPLLR